MEEEQLNCLSSFYWCVCVCVFSGIRRTPYCTVIQVQEDDGTPSCCVWGCIDRKTSFLPGQRCDTTRYSKIHGFMNSIDACHEYYVGIRMACDFFLDINFIFDVLIQWIINLIVCP